MAIDGRDIARARAAAESGNARQASPSKDSDAYESPVVRVLSHAIIWIPIIFVVWFAYWSGTWIGGPIAGVISLVLTAGTVVVVWVFRKAHKRRR
jgi:Flp pilus assembly protein TadB